MRSLRRLLAARLVSGLMSSQPGTFASFTAAVVYVNVPAGQLTNAMMGRLVECGFTWSMAQ
jgi:hypothetical protein